MNFSLGINYKKQSLPLKLSYLEPNTSQTLSSHLSEYFNQVPDDQPIIIVCIGTDRSTGDSLGPLVGSIIKKKHCSNIRLYGTLDEPVHALNLQDTINQITSEYSSPFIVAIDACLGQTSSVGCIQLGEGPVKPGAGVQKELPPVGHIHLTGIVNVGGFMEYFVLQNTRLSLVMNMAEIISDSIRLALLKTQRYSLHSL